QPPAGGDSRYAQHRGTPHGGERKSGNPPDDVPGTLLRPPHYRRQRVGELLVQGERNARESRVHALRRQIAGGDSDRTLISRKNPCRGFEPQSAKPGISPKGVNSRQDKKNGDGARS